MSSEESSKQTLSIIDWVDLNTVDPGFFIWTLEDVVKTNDLFLKQNSYQHRLLWKLQRTNYEPITRVVQI